MPGVCPHFSFLLISCTEVSTRSLCRQGISSNAVIATLAHSESRLRLFHRFTVSPILPLFAVFFAHRRFSLYNMDRRASKLTAATPATHHGQPVKECPGCGSAMAFSDRHTCCIGCLGFDHAVDALITPSSCDICASFGTSRLQSRIDKARRALQQEGTHIVDPDVGQRPKGATGPRQCDQTRSSVPRVTTSASFSAHHGLSCGESSGSSSRRSSSLSHNPFVNPEPPAEMEDDLPSYQPSSADVYMTSPRQVSEPVHAPRCRSPWESAVDEKTPSVCRCAGCLSRQPPFPPSLLQTRGRRRLSIWVAPFLSLYVPEPLQKKMSPLVSTSPRHLGSS